MRINVYHHEVEFMAARPELIRKTADTGVMFYGLRFYTEAPIMHQPGDDDSAALTLWAPWTRRGGHSTSELRAIACQIEAYCDVIESETGARGGAI